MCSSHSLRRGARRSRRARQGQSWRRVLCRAARSIALRDAPCALVVRAKGGPGRGAAGNLAAKRRAAQRGARGSW